MPIQTCEANGKPGYKWGDVGKCYTYEPGDKDAAASAQRKALAQGMAEGDTAKMADNELEAARLIQEHAGYRLTKDASGSLIIAWFPYDGDGGAGDDLAKALSQPSGIQPQDLHLTILYLGDAADYDLDLVAAITKVFTVSTGWGKIEGCVTGLGRFVGKLAGEDVVVALLDVPQLINVRNALKDALFYGGAVPVSSPLYNEEHGYLPHITLDYVARTQSSPTPLTETLPLCIDSLTVAAGDTRMEFDFIPPAYATASFEQPYYAARESISKAGRVLSGKHIKLVSAAIDALTQLHEAALREKDNPDSAEKAALYLADLEKAAGKGSKAPSMYNEDGSLADPAASANTEGDDADPTAPKPKVKKEIDASLADEIIATAKANAPEGGYGGVAYDPTTKTLFWQAADWTTDDEAAAAESAFLKISGVDKFMREAEAALPSEKPWSVICTEASFAKQDQLDYFVSKTRDEDRYTFGPLYAPERKDAHGEGTDAQTLQKAVWEYVQSCVDKGSNRLNLQHDDSGEATIGNWVEVCAWPYETTIKVAVPGEADRELTMPAGTVYMGVKWDQRAWDEGIKKGRLTGLSLGGRAIRVANAMSGDVPSMGDKLS